MMMRNCYLLFILLNGVVMLAVGMQPTPSLSPEFDEICLKNHPFNGPCVNLTPKSSANIGQCPTDSYVSSHCDDTYCKHVHEKYFIGSLPECVVPTLTNGDVVLEWKNTINCEKSPVDVIDIFCVARSPLTKVELVTTTTTTTSTTSTSSSTASTKPPSPPGQLCVVNAILKAVCPNFTPTCDKTVTNDNEISIKCPDDKQVIFNVFPTNNDDGQTKSIEEKSILSGKSNLPKCYNTRVIESNEDKSVLIYRNTTCSDSSNWNLHVTCIQPDLIYPTMTENRNYN